jgi:hypothetical protein
VTDLTRRYGAPSRARRPAVVAVALLLLAAGIAWLVWAAFLGDRPGLAAQLKGYQVRDPHHVVATFAVARTDGRAASCVLRAIADDHAVVGERTITVPSGRGTAGLRTTLRTERRATTVDLVGCRRQPAPG